MATPYPASGKEPSLPQHRLSGSDASAFSSSSHALDAAFGDFSSGSSHAMDVNLDMGVGDSADASASRKMVYVDFDGQLVYQKSDVGKERSLKRTIYEILRGRAMPVLPLAVSILWSIFAVVVSWATSKGYEPNENGDCRWWCSPLSIDGNALNHVGFALFLLTSFRVQE